MIVNEIVDLKGFKGKGDGAVARNWLQAATRQLQEVHDAMRQLKRETTAIRGHQFYLEVASVTRQQRKTLRWRMRGWQACQLADHPRSVAIDAGQHGIVVQG